MVFSENVSRIRHADFVGLSARSASVLDVVTGPTEDLEVGQLMRATIGQGQDVVDLVAPMGAAVTCPTTALPGSHLKARPAGPTGRPIPFQDLPAQVGPAQTGLFPPGLYAVGMPAQAARTGQPAQPTGPASRPVPPEVQGRQHGRREEADRSGLDEDRVVGPPGRCPPARRYVPGIADMPAGQDRRQPDVRDPPVHRSPAGLPGRPRWQATEVDQGPDGSGQ